MTDFSLRSHRCSFQSLSDTSIQSCPKETVLYSQLFGYNISNAWPFFIKASIIHLGKALTYTSSSHSAFFCLHSIHNLSRTGRCMQPWDTGSSQANPFNLNLFLSCIQLSERWVTVIMKQPLASAAGACRKGKVSQMEFSPRIKSPKRHNQSRWLKCFYECESQSRVSVRDYTSIYHSDGFKYWLPVSDSEE